VKFHKIHFFKFPHSAKYIFLIAEALCFVAKTNQVYETTHAKRKNLVIWLVSDLRHIYCTLWHSVKTSL